METCAGGYNTPEFMHAAASHADASDARLKKTAVEEARRYENHRQQKADEIRRYEARHAALSSMLLAQDRVHHEQCQEHVQQGVQTLHMGMKQIDQRIGSLFQLAKAYESLLCTAGLNRNAAYFQASRRYGMIRHALLKLNEQYDHLDLVSRNLPLEALPSAAIENFPSPDDIPGETDTSAPDEAKDVLTPIISHALPTKLAPRMEGVHQHRLPGFAPAQGEIHEDKMQSDSLLAMLRQDLFRLKTCLRKPHHAPDLPDNLPEDIQQALSLFRNLGNTLKAKGNNEKP